MSNTTKSDLKERLAQGAMEEIAMEVALNAVLPGAGLAPQALCGAKGLKKAAKVAGKGAAKEGIKTLDDENDAQDKLEELGGNLAVELLTRTGGR